MTTESIDLDRLAMTMRAVQKADLVTATEDAAYEFAAQHPWARPLLHAVHERNVTPDDLRAAKDASGRTEEEVYTALLRLTHGMAMKNGNHAPVVADSSPTAPLAAIVPIGGGGQTAEVGGAAPPGGAAGDPPSGAGESSLPRGSAGADGETRGFAGSIVAIEALCVRPGESATAMWTRILGNAQGMSDVLGAVNPALKAAGKRRLSYADTASLRERFGSLISHWSTEGGSGHADGSAKLRESFGPLVANIEKHCKDKGETPPTMWKRVLGEAKSVGDLMRALNPILKRAGVDRVITYRDASLFCERFPELTKHWPKKAGGDAGSAGAAAAGADEGKGDPRGSSPAKVRTIDEILPRDTWADVVPHLLRISGQGHIRDAIQNLMRGRTPRMVVGFLQSKKVPGGAIWLMRRLDVLSRPSGNQHMSVTDRLFLIAAYCGIDPEDDQGVHDIFAEIIASAKGDATVLKTSLSRALAQAGVSSELSNEEVRFVLGKYTPRVRGAA